MHELSIINEIVRLAEEKALSAGLGKVVSLTVKLGALSPMDFDSLSTCFEASAGGTILEGAKIKMEPVPAVVKCSDCRMTFDPGISDRELLHEIAHFPALIRAVMTCKYCGGNDVSVVSGDTVSLVEIEGE